MSNEIMEKEINTPVAKTGVQIVSDNQNQYCSVYDDVRTGKLVNEMIAAVREDRMNTKRAISASIASTARVQNQNDRVISACERELRRRDLSDDRRDELIKKMSRAAELTACESAACREFLDRQLEHSHLSPWKVLGFVVLIVIGGVGGRALLKATA